MTEKRYFTGPFAPLCEQYVALKKASGLDFRQQAMLLRMFDNFCRDYEIDNFTITKEIAIEWSRQRPNESEVYRNERIGIMQRFSEFLCQQGYTSYLLPACPKAHSNHIPYIFSKDELHRIFERLDNLAPTNSAPFRHLIMPVLFRMLYGCGLRISEALNLTKKDVDLEHGILNIHHAKNDRERIVPMSETLIKKCREYATFVHNGTSEETPFFCTKSEDRYTSSTIGKLFRGILWDVGIPYLGRARGPRLHDLRHPYVKYTTKNNCDNLTKTFVCTEPIRGSCSKDIQSQSCYRGKRKPALSASPQAIS